MRTVKASDPSSVRLAAESLSEGGTIVYPTDTLYGLGASILKAHAVMRTFDLKEMDPAPQSLVMSSLEMAERYVILTDLAREFFGVFPAGPFTFLLPVRDDPEHPVPTVLVREGTVGVRIPLHGFPRQVAALTGPITSTSANLHGGAPPKDFKEVSLSGADLYIDDGSCLYGSPSTILTQEGENLVILRYGALERTVIQRFLGDSVG